MSIVEKNQIDPYIASLEESGYIVEFLHVPSGKLWMFPSWITEHSDTWTSEWSSETVFGRGDQIGTYKGTTRKITLGLQIPSFSVREAHANMHQLEHMAAAMYPNYERRLATDANSLSISGSPIMKVKWANIIQDAAAENGTLSAAEGGLACWMDSLNITFDMSAGFHHPNPLMDDVASGARGRDYLGADDKGDLSYYNYNPTRHKHHKTENKSHFFIPKIINFSVNLNVIHEHKLGWRAANWLGTQRTSATLPQGATAIANYPYGFITLSGDTHHTSGRTAKTAASRTAQVQTVGAVINNGNAPTTSEERSQQALKGAIDGVFGANPLGGGI